MAVYKKVPGHETVNISTLEFDETPTPGSLNPVTSGGVAEAVVTVAEQTEQDMKEMEEMFLLNLPIAANTLRLEFSKMDYNPTVAGVGSSGTWKKVNAKFHNVWDFTKTGYASAFANAFKESDNLVSVIAANMTGVTNMFGTFQGCTSLTSVCFFDTSATTNMTSTFQGCTSLTNIPLFDTSATTNMNNMFNGCTKVEGGALALYQKASTQATPPANHTDTFKNCGKDTTTGSAELAQIPASWGGLAEE